MSDAIETVRGREVTIHFEARKCIHSRQCVLGRPDVFVPNAQGEWIHPDSASAAQVAELAHNCPSGAIRYERHDAGPQEGPPLVNLVRVRENGPLRVQGPHELVSGTGRTILRTAGRKLLFLQWKNDGNRWATGRSH